MMKNFLTHNKIEQLHKAHKKAKNKREADKIKTIVLLNNGWSYEQIAEALLLDDSTIRRYFENYQKHKNRIDRFLALQCKGTEPHLTQKQIKQLDTHLQENTYLDVSPIIAYIEKSFHITYSTRGLAKLLKRIGFVYKKPKGVPGKANRKAQEEFLELYESIKKQKGKNDPIYFGDAAHPTHNMMPAYGWFKKDARPTMPTNTSRKRINLNGALNVQTQELIYREDETINALSTIALFKQIEKCNPKANTIYLIIDNARYYRSKMVSEYIADSKIELLFLPPYAPNLNLIERFWRLLHKKVQYNRYHEKFDQFRQCCFDVLDNLHRYHTELDSLLTENFQLIGA